MRIIILHFTVLMTLSMYVKLGVILVYVIKLCKGKGEVQSVTWTTQTQREAEVHLPERRTNSLYLFQI
jgi:hypothetical protein